MLKDALPDSIVCTDVALDPYSSMGHDGIVEDGKILNDATIEQLCKQSVMQVAHAPPPTCVHPPTLPLMLT